MGPLEILIQDLGSVYVFLLKNLTDFMNLSSRSSILKNVLICRLEMLLGITVQKLTWAVRAMFMYENRSLKKCLFFLENLYFIVFNRVKEY